MHFDIVAKTDRFPLYFQEYLSGSFPYIFLKWICPIWKGRIRRNGRPLNRQNIEKQDHRYELQPENL